LKTSSFSKVSASLPEIFRFIAFDLKSQNHLSGFYWTNLLPIVTFVTSENVILSLTQGIDHHPQGCNTDVCDVEVF